MIPQMKYIGGRTPICSLGLMRRDTARKKNMAQEYAVKKIGVFGSVARNEQMEKSDSDLLVEFSRTGGQDHVHPSQKFSFQTAREEG
jgi:predicted nucleotidyltransferase